MTANNLAILTVFFNYPEDREPLFMNNIRKFSLEDDLYIARFNRLIDEGSSYYEKLTYYKIDALLPYIKEHIEEKYGYLLFLDSLDVNFYRPLEGIVEDFLSFNKSIVFCGEAELWPTTSYTGLYETKEHFGPARYLNSGGYIGYTSKIVEHLEDIVKNKYHERVTDQSLWTIDYLTSNDIAVDQECKIFFSTHKTKDKISGEPGNFCIKGLNPYIVHDNGPYGEDTLKIAHLL